MGAALLLALALAGGGRFERTNSRTEQGRSDRGLMSSSGALFEFAPLSGAGMGAACACAAVTGAKGEALTFSRASVGSCIKGSTTALANGDMVICASGQPRVMPGGDGTGGLGLLVEGGGANVVTRSEALDNAAYADFTSGGAAAPTVTADATTAPTGADTADMLSLPTTGLSEDSGRSIAVLTAAAYSAQVYVRGVTGPGEIDLCIEQTVGATCSTCAYTASNWTPCTVKNVTSIAGGRVLVGHLSTLSGVEHLAAASVYVWGLDAKLGAYVSSYVPTSGSAVARSADSAAFAISFDTAAGYSVAASALSSQTVALASGVWGVVASLYADGSNRTQIYRTFTNTGTVNHISSGGTSTASASGTVTWVDGAIYRTALSHTAPGAGSVATYYRDGTLYATSAPTTTSAFTATSLFLAGLTSGAALEPIIVYRVCVDPDPTRCR